MKKWKEMKKSSRQKLTSILVVIVLFAIVQVMIATGTLNRQMRSLLVPVTAYILAAIGLNMNVGISGELNLGQAGFMSLGGFTAVIAASVFSARISSPAVVFILAVLCGALMAGFLGWLISIPVLKLEGDYLAIVTLAFGQIIMSILNNLYVGLDGSGLHFSFVNNNISLGDGGKMIVSGPMGTTGVKTLSTFAGGVIMVLIALLIVYNIIDSKRGRAIEACRDNRIAAETVGINVARTKTLAFVLSSALGGAAGALYMLNYSSVTATKFDFNTSILILVYVVLGGLGNMTGTVIATAVLVLLPEVLRFLSSYRMLIYAVVLIVIMILTNNEKVRVFMARMKRRSGGKKGVESNG
ncbi:MAG: branched-chain amino acid ABC transporter permease [Lactimicrobium massiliense]|nr:branched-chain amino acid ABC transporter permease [Lactimicrobium massiliense]MDD6674228.1 branched-chain amino acid ABC transporter permease [Lactimicrobium massiliense]